MQLQAWHTTFITKETPAQVENIYFVEHLRIGQTLCQSLFFNKVADLKHATSLKRDSGTGVF